MADMCGPAGTNTINQSRRVKKVATKPKIRPKRKSNKKRKRS